MSFPLGSDEVPLMVRRGVGFAALIGILLSVYGLAFFAIAKAVQRKTLTWIIAGSFGVLVILTSWLLVISGVGMGIFRTYKSLTPPQSSVFAESYIPHTMQGWKMAYQVVLPKGWTPDWRDHDFDMTAEQGGLHLGIVAGQSEGETQVIERMARDRIKAVTQDSHLGESSTVEIDGRTWVQFDARYRQKASAQENFHQFYVYSGVEGMFQVVGWRIGGFRADDMETLRTIARSFRFPLGPSPPTPMPLVTQGRMFAYRLMIPAGWSVERSNIFDLRATRELQSICVMVAGSQNGNAPNVLRAAQDVLQQSASDLHLSATSMAKIDGRDWLHFTATWRLKENSYVQEYYVYAGPEGMFQVIGLARQGQSKQDTDTLNNILMSFHFPPKT